MCDVINILLPLYLTLSACTGCDFPPDLQSNGSRDWKGRIREQNSGQSWDISFSGDTMRGDARDNLVTSYTRLCLTDQTSQGHNKYIVSHQDDGRESPTYLCVQVSYVPWEGGGEREDEWGWQARVQGSRGGLGPIAIINQKQKKNEEKVILLGKLDITSIFPV